MLSRRLVNSARLVATFPRQTILSPDTKVVIPSEAAFWPTRDLLFAPGSGLAPCFRGAGLPRRKRGVLLALRNEGPALLTFRSLGRPAFLTPKRRLGEKSAERKVRQRHFFSSPYGLA
jgi:hypothetical protein